MKADDMTTEGINNILDVNQMTFVLKIHRNHWLVALILELFVTTG
jgi:hypothetical protein